MEKFTVAIPKVMLSYPHLIEKQPLDSVYIKTEEKRKYCASFLLDKNDENHKKAIEEIKSKQEKLLKLIDLDQNAHILIKDGDKEYDRVDNDEKRAKNEYKRGKFILTAANGFQPMLTNKNGESFDPEKEENIFYPGCYVHAFIELSPYKFNGFWKGISNRLQHVQFSKHGKMLGAGLLSGASAFGKFEDSDDDDDFGSFNANDDKNLF